MTGLSVLNRSARSAAKILGEVVTYHTHAGLVRTMRMIVERNVVIYSASAQSGVSELRTKISFPRADAPHWKRGEIVIDGSGNKYTLQDELEDSAYLVQVSARHE